MVGCSPVEASRAIGAYVAEGDDNPLTVPRVLHHYEGADGGWGRDSPRSRV
jgi:hypothetical protein